MKATQRKKDYLHHRGPLRTVATATRDTSRGWCCLNELPGGWELSLEIVSEDTLKINSPWATSNNITVKAIRFQMLR